MVFALSNPNRFVSKQLWSQVQPTHAFVLEKVILKRMYFLRLSFLFWKPTWSIGQSPWILRSFLIKVKHLEQKIVLVIALCDIVYFVKVEPPLVKSKLAERNKRERKYLREGAVTQLFLFYESLRQGLRKWQKGVECSWKRLRKTYAAKQTLNAKSFKNSQWKMERNS